jgi:hypothetical protein
VTGPDPACDCLEPKLGRCERDGRNLGTDLTNARYGEVWLWTCEGCGRIWLFYRVEYESFTASGRWFRAVVSKETAEKVTPETAADTIARSDYRILGGSYFDTPGRIERGQGRVPVDL